MDDKEYIAHYNAFLARIKNVRIPWVPEALKPLIARLNDEKNPAKDILDLGCGNGRGLKELFDLGILERRVDRVLVGHDKNQMWEPEWLSNLDGQSRIWDTNIAPIYKGTINCAHSFYFPEIREIAFRLFQSNPNDDAVMLVRGMSLGNILADLSRRLKLPSYFWDFELFTKCAVKGYDYQGLAVLSVIEIPYSELRTMLGHLEVFIPGIRSLDGIEEILQRMSFTKEDLFTMNNDDVIYFITKK